MVSKVREEIEVSPICCGDFITKEKIADKWLGDIFHRVGWLIVLLQLSRIGSQKSEQLAMKRLQLWMIGDPSVWEVSAVRLIYLN
jgi:hypothetical protein